jgi:lipopolysaccharide heptosyltransferase II
MMIKTLKFVDRFLGRLATGLLPAPVLRPVTSPRSALFIRPGGIGDAVLLLPALRAFQQVFPSCSIDVLAEKRNAAAFGFLPGIRQVFCYEMLSGLTKAIWGSYDMVIDTEQWYRLSATVARITNAPIIIGFASNERGRLLSHPVPYDMELYEPLSFFRLLKPLGIPEPATVEVPYLTIEAAAQTQGDRLLAPLAGKSFVAIFPGASTPEKLWSRDKFRQIAQTMHEKGFAVVIVGGEDVHSIGADLVQGLDALNLAGAASLAVTAAVMSRAKALICGDTGLLHIAVALDTPTISLFGPSDPHKWGPKGMRHLVLRGSNCSPCSRFGNIPPCTVQERCMDQLSVSEVLRGFESVTATVSKDSNSSS